MRRNLERFPTIEKLSRLIITAGEQFAQLAPAQAILVSDRRFTINGRLVDEENDEENKAAVLFCADGRVTICYSRPSNDSRLESARKLKS